MKILVITDLYPVKDDEKYTPKTIYDFVKEWEKSGHEVKVVKPNFILNSFVRKKTFYRSGIYNNVENINYWLPFLGNIRNKMKTEFAPDIVIAHMPSGLIFANKLGLPFTAGVHISDTEVLTNKLYSFYFKRELELAYFNAKNIACRSEVLKKKFLKLYPQYENKTFVAYSGIQEGIIIKRNWNYKEKYKVLTCANLKKRKNIDKLILACKDLDNIDLTVIGDGEELKNLKKINANNVTFTGYLPNSEVIKNMRASDIFILPSENETFGMVYLEAMASGCITVCLKNDGVDGIIKDGENGYVTELNNIRSVLVNIIQSNTQNFVLNNSYETILRYTEKKAAEQYLNNISTVCAPAL